MSPPLVPSVVSNQTIRPVEPASTVEHNISAVVVTSPEGQLVGIAGAWRPLSEIQGNHTTDQVRVCRPVWVEPNGEICIQ